METVQEDSEDSCQDSGEMQCHQGGAFGGLMMSEIPQGSAHMNDSGLSQETRLHEQSMQHQASSIGSKKIVWAEEFEGNGNGQAAEAPSGPGREKSVMVCRHWKSKGWCKLGDDCKFLHPDHKRGAGIAARKSPAGANSTMVDQTSGISLLPEESSEVVSEVHGQKSGPSESIEHEQSETKDVVDRTARIRRGGRKNRRGLVATECADVPVVASMVVPGPVLRDASAFSALTAGTTNAPSAR